MDSANPRLTEYSNSTSVTGRDTTLLDYLLQISAYPHPNTLAAHQVAEKYGKASPLYTRAKSKLAAVTIVGRFSGRRRQSDLLEFSGLMPFDVDGLLEVEFPDQWDLITGIENVVFAHRTASGSGIRFAIRVAVPKHTAAEKLVYGYKRLYNTVRDKLLEAGIKLDTVGATGVSRLFYMAYDPDMYYQPAAEEYRGYWPVQSVHPLEDDGAESDDILNRAREEVYPLLSLLADAALVHPESRDAIMFRLDWLFGRAETNRWLKHYFPDSRRSKTRGDSPARDVTYPSIAQWLKEEAAAARWFR